MNGSLLLFLISSFWKTKKGGQPATLKNYLVKNYSK